METVRRAIARDRVPHDTVLSDPAEFAAFIRAEWVRNAKVVKLSGAKVD